MFQGLVTTLKCLAGCLTHWPHQSLPLSSDNPPCCRSEVPGSSGDQARAAKVRSSILSLPCLVLLPEAWGGLEKVGQSAYLPWCLDGKEPACNAGDLASIPGMGQSPGGGHGNPLQYSCLENPKDRGACSPRGCKESDTPEQLSAAQASLQGWGGEGKRETDTQLGLSSPESTTCHSKKEEKKRKPTIIFISHLPVFVEIPVLCVVSCQLRGNKPKD